MMVHDLARFIKNATCKGLPGEAENPFRTRPPGSQDTAIEVSEGESVQLLRKLTGYPGGTEQVARIGGGKFTPDR